MLLDMQSCEKWKNVKAEKKSIIMKGNYKYSCGNGTSKWPNSFVRCGQEHIP